MEAKGDDERELKAERYRFGPSLTAKVPFDDRFHATAQVADLSVHLMREFLTEVESQLADVAVTTSAEVLGRQMNVVDGPTEAPRSKNVGLLFFNEKPHQFFPATQIDVVWFPEGAGGDRFEEKIFQGPLGRITRDALSFIERSYLSQTIIKYPDRPQADRVWNFPLAAIEEALVNAVYHRSYEIREPIEVRISQDDIVVLSFPGPDRSIRLADLSTGKAVSRRYRNRRIGEFLKELELTEGRSTGISKIFKVMKANGSPAPEFDTDEDRSYFLTRLPIHTQAVRVDSSRASTAQVTHHEGSVIPQATPQVARLLSVLKGELDRGALQSIVEIWDRKYFRKAYLGPAIKAGLVEMTIPDHPNNLNQKYRLTEAGKRWVGED